MPALPSESLSALPGITLGSASGSVGDPEWRATFVDWGKKKIVTNEHRTPEGQTDMIVEIVI